jgi:threonine dehydrogenase-like Zn-dependent dehydrogenase
VVVVGDGAVGLCGVLAAKRLGAAQIIAMSRHDDRAAVAVRFGATDIVAARGREAVEAVKELTAGRGAPHVLECVGTQESLDTAVRSVRKGGHIGMVGVPHPTDAAVISALFGRNAFLGGGGAPARTYIPELLADVLAGTLDPAPVFDLQLSLAEVARGYDAMDKRTAIKVLLRP